MRPTILFLDTNILLDCPRLEDYRLTGRLVTLVVIPEVMRELRGLARARDRGQAGPALLALGTLETMARRRGSALGVPAGRSGVTVRVLPDAPDAVAAADRPLVRRARGEQERQPGAMVAVVTRDRGVADLARAERVKSILLWGAATPAGIARGVAEHDTSLDLDL